MATIRSNDVNAFILKCSTLSRELYSTAKVAKRYYSTWSNNVQHVHTHPELVASFGLKRVMFASPSCRDGLVGTIVDAVLDRAALSDTAERAEVGSAPMSE
jgi:hypothetical protein